MNDKQAILDAHIAHPEWTAGAISSATGIPTNTVRSIVGRIGITLPSEHLARQRLREAIGGRLRKPFKRISYAGKP